MIRALTADGWTITHDPLTISYGGKDLYVDLGVERHTIGAERGTERIAVEIQSFLNPSPIRDLEEAVGQYAVYRAVLDESEPRRTLYMAVPRRVLETVLADRFGSLIVERLGLKILGFDENDARIIRWIP